MKLSELFSGFFSLFYPRICPGCNNTLIKNEIFLCTHCILELPLTHFYKDPENEVAQMFWGRVQIENASAYLYFNKKSIVQQLLHKLKYKGEKEIGEFLGRLIGHELKDTAFEHIDYIVPLPLHRNRQKQRGYNQSEMIAVGIAGVFNKKVMRGILVRKIANPTQTRKHRYERWLNVQEVFEVTNYKTIANKHILLVDDVITTGATLEASAAVLLEGNNTRVSIIAVAKA